MTKLYKNMSYDRALEKAMRYCSYQERCQLDLTNRFRAWNVANSDWDKLLDYLIEENYLNETRYVEAFVRGKFRIKRWGKHKIKMGLINKRVFNEKTIEAVFTSEIDEEEYFKSINELIEKKSRLINEENSFIKRDKIYRYMLNKGYESNLISSALSSIIFP